MSPTDIGTTIVAALSGILAAHRCVGADSAIDRAASVLLCAADTWLVLIILINWSLLCYIPPALMAVTAAILWLVSIKRSEYQL